MAVPKRSKGLARKASRRRKPCRGSNPFCHATTVKMNKIEHTVLQNRPGVIVPQGDLTEYMLDVWFAKPKLQYASWVGRLGERLQISFRLVQLQYDAPINEN